MSVAALLQPTTHDIVPHRQSLQLRSSSEDTALNIFSMYSTGRSTFDSERPLSYVMESPEIDEARKNDVVVESTPTQHSQSQDPDQPPSATTDSEEPIGSFEPAPGEDAESFHVRSTYAQLEVHGVPGDGFQDGMELTRTRSNAVRTKLDANFRTSPEDELRFLSMVDRYGFYLPPTSQIDRVAVLPAASFAKKLSPISSPSKGSSGSLKEGGKLRPKAPSRPTFPRSSSPAPPTLTVPKSARFRSRSASPISARSHSRSQSLSNPQSPASSAPPNPPRPRHETSRLAKWYRMLIPLPEPMQSHVGSSSPYPNRHLSTPSRSHSHSPSTSSEPHSHSPDNQAARYVPSTTPVYGGGNVLYWTVHPKKGHKLRERVFKGVPDAWRAAAWGVLLEKSAGVQRERFETLKQDYFATLDKPSPFDIQIDLDVPRTISGHITFRTRYGSGQRALFRVLHAFSLRCDECGYVQGMGPIAATLLLYFEPEKAYAIMVILHESAMYDMHNVVKPGFPGLLEAIYVMERVVLEKMPGVYEVFKKNMISSTSYTTKWFITLFANTVPFQTQLRLWDVFFLEGKDALVMASVGILWVFRDTLQSPNSSFETILSLLSSFFVPEDEDKLLSWMETALKDWKLREQMRQWRAEWEQKGSSGGLEVL